MIRFLAVYARHVGWPVTVLPHVLVAVVPTDAAGVAPPPAVCTCCACAQCNDVLMLQLLQAFYIRIWKRLFWVVLYRFFQSACFVSETTQLLLIKFGIVGLH